jgi:YebC/PmpR family DNA-binding regulatory protein
LEEIVSGHSKWANIKHRKGAQDARRAKIFTRLGKEITIAARDGGADLYSNSSLRTAISTARSNNMPNDKIDRAIKRGTGELEGARLEEITYEGYGHGGVAILVQCVTDNLNRTAADVRHAFNKNGGKMGRSGSVGYLFETKGIITVREETANENRIMEVVIDAGAENVETQDGVVQISTPSDAFHAVLNILEENQIATESAELSPVASTTIQVTGKDAEGVLKLIMALDDLDDTSRVSANFEIDEEELTRLQEAL